MKFVEDRPDIPDDLIRAALDGRATFLCGAGLSRRVGLASFQKLTDDVYTRLGESRAHEAAERVAYDRGEYDRVLRSLEKRTHRPSTSSRVREAVAALLAAPASTALPDHTAVLRISRDGEGRPRVLTTNFDTLFERAALDAGIGALASHAGVALPKPASQRDHGVLHLHGRIEDAGCNLSETDLVLTSADFGDAYLRNGWASRYIEDRMRVGALVLLGYGAEDAAMRLLLDALDADRERFPDLSKIYAIDRASADSASLWKAKGITPLECGNFDKIYATIGEWARFAEHPAGYARSRLEAILR